jgi:hypothetical protein
MKLIALAERERKSIGDLFGVMIPESLWDVCTRIREGPGSQKGWMPLPMLLPIVGLVLGKEG